MIDDSTRLKLPTVAPYTADETGFVEGVLNRIRNPRTREIANVASVFLVLLRPYAVLAAYLLALGIAVVIALGIHGLQADPPPSGRTQPGGWFSRQSPLFLFEHQVDDQPGMFRRGRSAASRTPQRRFHP